MLAWVPVLALAQRNPQPVLLRLMDNAVLPNQFRSKVKECFVVGAGYGDVSSERAYIRTESLSCITREGTAIDVPVKGYVAGEDGKAGMRGRRRALGAEFPYVRPRIEGGVAPWRRDQVCTAARAEFSRDLESAIDRATPP